MLADAGTGSPVVDTAFAWAAGLVALVGVFSASVLALRWLYRLLRVVEAIHSDFIGEQARPGVPARPGVIERVSGIEERVARIERELHPEGGASLRAAVDLANTRLARLCDSGREGHDPPLASP